MAVISGFLTFTHETVAFKSTQSQN